MDTPARPRGVSCINGWNNVKLESIKVEQKFTEITPNAEK